MKKIILLSIAIMLFAIGVDAQKDSVKVKKYASWTISDCYQAQPGFVGSYWANSFNIAKDKDGYYFVFNMYSDNGYYTLNVNETPYVYFKDKDGKIIQLRRDEEPYYTFTTPGYWSGNIYMKMRYVTRFIYDIDDINEFMSHTFVKYRISLGEGFSDIDMSDGYYKQFNKRIKACVDQVDALYQNK